MLFLSWKSYCRVASRYVVHFSNRLAGCWQFYYLSSVGEVAGAFIGAFLGLVIGYAVSTPLYGRYVPLVKR